MALNKYLNVYAYLYYRIYTSGGIEKNNRTEALLLVMYLFTIHIYFLLTTIDFFLKKQLIIYFNLFFKMIFSLSGYKFVILWLLFVVFSNWLISEANIPNRLKEKFKDETLKQKRIGKVYLYCQLFIPLLARTFIWQ